MNGDMPVYLCGLHSLGFAVFHVAFWKLFDWPRSLQSTTLANRAVIQILNLRLIYVLFGVAAACFLFPEQLRTTTMGRALLGFMVLFWVGRTIEQFAFLRVNALRVNRPMVHALTGLFVLGAVLFALPLLG